MPSVDTASAILASLDALGVTHVLYCPGSRSAPFAYALEAGAFSGYARAVLDERGAGFAAVGLSVGVAAAAAVPGVPRAAGLATASLLVGDVTQPLIPERGRLPVGRLEPDQDLIDRTPVDGDLVSRWGMRLEGMAEHLKVGSR